MIILGITIHKLFNQFDYDIVFNHGEGITILTGPNGYGKTTILNILWCFFNQDFMYIIGLPFENIAFQMKDEKTITITKQYITEIRATADGQKQAFNKSALQIELASKGIVLETAIVDGEKPLDNQTAIANLLEDSKVYLIKDQRLTKKVIPMANGLFKCDGSINLDGKPVEVNTVRVYANDLRNQISQNKEDEQKLTQSLDASLRKRFKEYQTILPESEYKERFRHVLKKYQALQECGIYQDDLEPTEYEGDERRFFSLNLEDWEKRTALYDNLMARIKVFVETLTEKSLTNKRVAINAGEGISFTTLGGKQLEYACLSSGEQNETILLYELLFNSKPESLVLIDEPETSLHVAWQQLFLQDLMTIAVVNQLSFLVATHSPDIINDKIDLSIDLYALAHGEQDDDK